MKVVIMHRTITVHDAIGADISRMMDCLSQDHSCYAYCENLLNKNLCALSDDPVQEIIQDKNNLIIYHHSGYWKEGLDLLKRAKCKIIIRYHNITPPHFFKQYSDDHMQFCQEGLKQTDTLVSDFKNALWLSDSKYNISDFEKSIQYKVLPPLNYIDKWKDCTPDNRILKELIDSGKINLLFVGRIVPNKSIDFLFEVVYEYKQKYGENICLNIIGKKDWALAKYNSFLDTLAEIYKLSSNIRFIGEITDGVLLSYYLGCDFYLNCSEHEGFCVPIVEAQYLGLPVISKRSSAVPETIGEEQLLLNNNIAEYSAAIKVLSENDAFYSYLRDVGYSNYQGKFDNKKLTDEFKSIVNQFMGECL